ncbi:MAG: RlmE family RNA methyltransferase [Candidatus Heimdallarchaeaceae archaeon]
MKSEDYFYLAAKRQGFRSRASYKLIQINEKFKIFTEGQKVVDLGASPGGWSQVASMQIGKEGHVIAIDRAYIPPFKNKNVTIVQMDIMNEGLEDFILDNFGRIDVLLSDCAPNVSGTWDRDQSIQLMLAERAFELSKKLLVPNGWLVTKIFQGGDFPSFYALVKDSFVFVKLFKPKASRKQSAEIYLIAHQLKIKDNESCNDE